MKTGIVIPITNLDRFGYQYTADLCLQNLINFFNVVALIQCDPCNAYTERLIWNLKTSQDHIVVHASIPETWYPDDRFDLDTYQRNIRIGTEMLRGKGVDVAINGSCNWYVRSGAADDLRDLLRAVVEHGQPYAWQYVRYQLGHWLSGPAVCHPSILNLRFWQWEFTVTDGVRSGAVEMQSRRGDWRGYSSGPIVDCGYMLPLSDLQAKLEYVRFYRDLIPTRPKVWDWEYWQSYYSSRIKAMPDSADLLDDTGVALAERERASFLSTIRKTIA